MLFTSSFVDDVVFRILGQIQMSCIKLFAVTRQTALLSCTPGAKGLLSQIAVLCSLISVWFSVVVAVWRFIVTNPSYLVCMWNFVYAYVPCGVPFVVMSMFVFLQRFFVVIWISPTVRGIICFRIAILPWYMIRHTPTEYYVASLMVLISVHL